MNNYKKIFSLIAPEIEKFVAKYGMVIEKYPHDSANWTLFFKRKIGGVVQICINYLQKEQIDSYINTIFEIILIWTVDDYDREIRHIKRIVAKEYIYQDKPFEFYNILEQCLDMVSDMKFSDLCQHIGGMKDWKKYWKTKEEFNSISRYPVLDI